jgi:hypothetical protein
MKFDQYYNGKTVNDNSAGKRRSHPRRTMDVCMVNVDGHPYPVQDWSQGGVLFECDTRPYEAGQTVNMILRFKIGQAIEDIKVTGNIVRKNAHAVAAQFTQLPQNAMYSFEKVIQSA